jgi:hypothetical protein
VPHVAKKQLAACVPHVAKKKDGLLAAPWQMSSQLRSQDEMVRHTACTRLPSSQVF